MIYDAPAPDDPLDQGDLIEGCPVVEVSRFDPADPAALRVESNVVRVVLLTQTCDFGNQKTNVSIAAPAADAQFLVDQGVVKAAEVRGGIRSGRVWGWYFLPADPALGIPEIVVDLRRLYTVRLGILSDLCRAGRRRGRVKPLYREHFADTYSRIGLPRPYETL